MAEQPNEKKAAEAGLPEVAQPPKRNPWVLVVLALLLLVFGGRALWYFYAAKKTAPVIEETYSVPEEDAVKQSQPAASSRGPLQIPAPTAATSVPAAASNTLTPQQMAFIQAKQKELQQRLAAPMLVVNNTSASATAAPTKPVASSDPNTQFMNQVAAQTPDTIQATVMGNLSYLIAEGNLIHGVLETAINSDLPGYVRAIVSQPVYAEDGSHVLIPPGSRLIGQYRSGMLQGQSRVFVVWSRLITPGGISISLGSPGVDNLGVAGVGADAIDRHFWQQFGNALLLSIIGAGAANLDVGRGDEYNAAQAYRIAVADSFAQTANRTLKLTGVIAPTLHINQGKPIMVFVAHDLNFQQAMQQAKPKVNVF